MSLIKVILSLIYVIVACYDICVLDMIMIYSILQQRGVAGREGAWWDGVCGLGQACVFRRSGDSIRVNPRGSGRIQFFSGSGSDQ